MKHAFRYIMQHAGYAQLLTDNSIEMFALHQLPVSHGNLTLSDQAWNTTPVVDSNMFGEAADLDAMVKAARQAHQYPPARQYPHVYPHPSHTRHHPHW